MTGTRARLQASFIRALNAWLLKGTGSRREQINGDSGKFTRSVCDRTLFEESLAYDLERILR